MVQLSYSITLAFPSSLAVGMQLFYEDDASDGAAIDEGGSSSHIDDIARRSL